MMKAENRAEENMRTALISYPPQVTTLPSAFQSKELHHLAQISPKIEHDELQIDSPDRCRSNNDFNCLSNTTSRCPIADPLSVTITHDTPATMPSLLQLDEQDSKQTTLLSHSQPSTLAKYTFFARDKKERRNVDGENKAQKQGFGRAVGQYFLQRHSPAVQEGEATSLMGRPIPLNGPVNSTPAPDGTAQVATIAHGSVPAPTDTGAFVCEAPSPELMYRFRDVSGLYVGLEDKVRPLPGQLEKWQNRIKPRLLTDIQEFERKMKKTRKARGGKPGLSPELRMSGYTVMGTGKVKLMPRIWILYDQDKWKKSVQAFVKELEWLGCEGFGDVEVHKGCPMLATVDTWPFIHELELDESRAYHLADGMALHFHVEKPQGDSACGLVYCVTLTRNGVVVDQRLSRIGGLLCVDDETFGITTAHGMLEWLWDSEFQDSSSNNETSDTESMCSDDTESETPHTPDKIAGLHDDGADNTEEDCWSEHIGSMDPLHVLQWDHVQTIGLTSFLGTHAFNLDSFLQHMGWSSESMIGHKKSQSSGKSISHSISEIHHEESLELYQVPGSEFSAHDTGPVFLHPPGESSDFSLWRIPNMETLHNTYATSDLKTIKIDGISVLNDASDGTVQLLLGNELVLDGILLPGNMSFILHGVVFRTRKIRTSAPLARGCSGSWVVRAGQFCGVVIASYEAEPYVHMITSQDLMHDIKASGSHIRSIELPNHRVMDYEERLQETHDAGSAELSPSLPLLPANQRD